MRQLLKFLFLTLAIIRVCPAQELRGTWIARNSLSSKESLAAAIDSLARNNFNTIYINAWSRGFPLWNSDFFARYTGLTTDPQYAGRDILAETIAEAHSRGMNVEAWFEYGFVGWYAPDSIPRGVFLQRPEWIAKKRNGGQIDNSKFFWMVQTRKDVQDFLIGLATEVCRKYDVDGIELDRIRYSSTQYGYDSYTDSLYRSENSGVPPPSNENDAAWIRWRADKINQFMARAYDSIKAVSSKIHVSNAPSLYSSSAYTAYNDYCQDWVHWVNTNKVDYVQLQMYVSPLSTFSAIVNFAVSLIQDKSKLYPAMATIGSGFNLTNQEVRDYVAFIRSKGLKGVALWYYSDLIRYFPYLKSEIFTQSTIPPLSSPDWRAYYKTVTLLDTASISATGQWTQSTLPGLTGISLQAASSLASSISYTMNIPASGWYELYAFQVTAINRTDSAMFTVFSGNIAKTSYVDQSKSDNKRWYKIGDYYLEAGARKVLEISNAKVKPGTFISADAVMISLNRRISPTVTSIHSLPVNRVKKKSETIVIRNYPNPFNSSTIIAYQLPETEPYDIRITNITGETVLCNKGLRPSGAEERISFGDGKLASGMYFCTIRQKNLSGTIKILFMK